MFLSLSLSHDCAQESPTPSGMISWSQELSRVGLGVNNHRQPGQGDCLDKQEGRGVALLLMPYGVGDMLTHKHGCISAQPITSSSGVCV